MKKLIYDVIVDEAIKDLNETWDDYLKGGWFNTTTFDDVLEAEKKVIQAKRMRRQNHDFSRSS